MKVKDSNIENYYVRALFGPFAFYVGIALVLFAVVAFVSGHSGAGWRLVAPGALGVIIGGANRKPRVSITPDNIVCGSPGLGAARTIPRDALAGVAEEKNGIRLTKKDGTSVLLPKYDFSKKTRKALLDRLKHPEDYYKEEHIMREYLIRVKDAQPPDLGPSFDEAYVDRNNLGFIREQGRWLWQNKQGGNFTLSPEPPGLQVSCTHISKDDEQRILAYLQAGIREETTIIQI